MLRYPLRPAGLSIRALALLAATLVPMTSQAVVVMAGKDQKREDLLEKAHQAGLAHPWVVGLSVAARNRHPTPLTGVFLGAGADGRTAHVLTAAHLLIADGNELREITGIDIVFGPSLTRFQPCNGLKFKADRVFVHPGFQMFPDQSVADSKGVRRALALARNDLAILRFDLGPDGLARLEARGIRPARLYAGSESRTPLMEAITIGYGQSGSTEDLYLDQPTRIHAGMTRVTYGTWRGLTGYLHWSPMAKASESGEMTHPCRCEPSPRLNYVDPVTQGFIPVETHPEQVLGSYGDSGGPLVFLTPRGAEVAGVYSAFAHAHLSSYFTGAEPRLFHFQYWVPVEEHLDWIRPLLEPREGEEAERQIDLSGDLPDLEAWGILRELERKEEKKG